nr:FG-GAP repeat protein [uncultured Rhodoferax sp.]
MMRHDIAQRSPSRTVTRWGTLLTAAVLASGLSACGGGGGGGGGSSSSATASTWSQQAYVKVPNAETDDEFGASVAISGDTLVIAAYQEDSNQTTITNGSTASADNSASTAGAAYVFVRSGSSWGQQAYLKTPNAEADDACGISVAISGDTIVVGANLEDSNQTTITNGSTASADNSATNAGAAYVFLRSGSTWSQQAYLKAPNANAHHLFGSSVAISGNTIVVGAHQEASNQITITNGTTASTDNSASNAGAAYVFLRSGTAWSQQAYLKAPNAEADDHFGTSVAISGDTIVVGATSESSNQTTITNGTTASADNSATNAGAAYVFVRGGSSWSQQAYLKAPNAEAIDQFGSSLAISGDTIVVGAPNEDSNQTTITNSSTASTDNLASNAGAAYVFVRSGSAWSQQAYLKAPNAESGDDFGLSMAISGDTIVVGARLEDSNQTTITNGSSASTDNSAPNAGAAYVFVRSGNSWSQQAYLKAPNAGASDQFGRSVAISGGTIVVGATGEDSNQTTITNGSTASADNSATTAGAAYIFNFGS